MLRVPTLRALSYRLFGLIALIAATSYTLTWLVNGGGSGGSTPSSTSSASSVDPSGSSTEQTTTTAAPRGGTFVSALFPWEVLIGFEIPITILVRLCGLSGWTLYAAIYDAAWTALRSNRRREFPPGLAARLGAVGGQLIRTASGLLLTVIALGAAYLAETSGQQAATQRAHMGPHVEQILAAADPRAVALSNPAVLVNQAQYVAAAVTAAAPSASATVFWFFFRAACYFVAFVLDAVVYSFLCFELRLTRQKSPTTGQPVELSDQLLIFESNLPYYIGYGTLQHVGQLLLLRVGPPLWAALFVMTLMPLHIVTAVNATPGPETRQVPLISAVTTALPGVFAVLRGLFAALRIGLEAVDVPSTSTGGASVSASGSESKRD
jgi:hypothetical protein